MKTAVHHIVIQLLIIIFMSAAVIGASAGCCPVPASTSCCLDMGMEPGHNSNKSVPCQGEICKGVLSEIVPQPGVVFQFHVEQDSYSYSLVHLHLGLLQQEGAVCTFSPPGTPSPPLHILNCSYLI